MGQLPDFLSFDLTNPPLNGDPFQKWNAEVLVIILKQLKETDQQITQYNDIIHNLYEHGCAKFQPMKNKLAEFQTKQELMEVNYSRIDHFWHMTKSTWKLGLSACGLAAGICGTIVGIFAIIQNWPF